MSPSSNGDGSESQLETTTERKRVTLACLVCKKRKIRCDGNPEKCDNCKGFGTECIYIDSGVKRGPQKGYKFKRKRSVGESQDSASAEQRERGGPLNLDRRAQGTASQSPVSHRNGLDDRSTLHGSVPSGSANTHSDRAQGPTLPPFPASPPLSTVHRSTTKPPNRMVAPLPARAQPSTNEQPSQPRPTTEETHPATNRLEHVVLGLQEHTRRDSAISPDIGDAISALESLSEVRNYSSRRESTFVAGDPTFGDDSPADQVPHISSTNREQEAQQRDRSSATRESVRVPRTAPDPVSSRNSEDGMTDTRCHDPHGVVQDPVNDLRIDRHTQDKLLAVYWTHIHNVWPLLYKPEFYPSTVHKPLLLAMLAAASAIPTPGKTILNAAQAEQLFEQAQDAVLIRRATARSRTATSPQQDHFHEIAPAKSSLQTVQCMILFSLRQTSNGNKSSAYLWFCHAAAMALELGLHRVVLDKSRHVPQADIESRCRVFWTCYVIDKSFSEEMGRPVLLRASTTSTPLPSTLEADEYELWPPPSVSLGQNSRSRSRGNQLHIQPMKSRTMTCFNATVRLAHIVEQCLDLDNELLVSATSGSGTDSRQLVVMDEATLQDELSRIEKQKEQLARRLTEWWDRLDPDLRVDTRAKVCPPIHFVVNCCWYYSATIFLHSKDIGPKPSAGLQSERYQTSHRICSEAAGKIVALLGCLDNFKILAPASSDIIHMLSHAALFHAYNAAIPQNEYAASAEANFQQCCLWLQEIGSFWAPASVQRQFFEGLVKGGKELTAKHRNTSTQTADIQSSSLPVMSVPTPSQLLQQSPSLTPSFVRQPTTTGVDGPTQGADYSSTLNTSNMPAVPDSSDLFRVRSHFWNEFLPNAEQVNADRRQSELASFATNLSEDLGSLYDLSTLNQSHTSHFSEGETVINGDEMSLAALANLAQAASTTFPMDTSANAGSSSQMTNNVDPADWLVAYMLDSIHPAKP